MSLDFRPKLEKIVELLLYLAHKKPGSDKYQAVKFLYLADKRHLERYGRPITFDKYFALEYGPVASAAKDIIEWNEYIVPKLKRIGIDHIPFDVEIVDRKGPEQDPLMVIQNPRRAVDFVVFSKSDIEVFDEIISEYGDCSFDDLYNVTHAHNAYVKAWAKRGLKKSSPMEYGEMIESDARRSSIVSDIGPVSSHM